MATWRWAAGLAVGMALGAGPAFADGPKIVFGVPGIPPIFASVLPHELEVAGSYLASHSGTTGIRWRELGQVLFEELELPVLKRLKTGPSTDQDVLEKLGKTSDELRAYVEQHPEMSRALYKVPKYKGVIGTAANFAIHVTEKMGQPVPYHADAH